MTQIQNYNSKVNLSRKVLMCRAMWRGVVIVARSSFLSSRQLQRRPETAQARKCGKKNPSGNGPAVVPGEVGQGQLYCSNLKQ